jgi:hypothetical protein
MVGETVEEDKIELLSVRCQSTVEEAAYGCRS